MDYPAKVINNIDTDMKGKVQIYIEPLMYGVLPTDYPWAYPDREWTSNIPEINDFVWVYFEDERNWKKPFYKNKVDFDSLLKHAQQIGSMVSQYPDVKYIKLKNGIALGMSSSLATPEISLYHPTGSEIHILSTGDIQIKSGVNTITVSATTGISIGTAATEFAVLGTSFLTWLTTFITTIFNTHTHATAAVGPPSVPSVTATAPTNILSTTTKIK